MTKLELQKQMVASKIEYYERLVCQCEEQIKTYANGSRYSMITFLPSVCDEMKRYVERLEQLNETKLMLEFLEKDENK